MAKKNKTAAAPSGSAAATQASIAKATAAANPNTRDQLGAFKKQTADVDLANLSPEQLSQLQLEEALKESSNPKAGLKQLHNPLGVRGCLINLLLLIAITLVVGVVICYFWIDRFNLWVVLYDMLVKFKLVYVWELIVKTVSGWFAPKGVISAIISWL